MLVPELRQHAALAAAVERGRGRRRPPPAHGRCTGSACWARRRRRPRSGRSSSAARSRPGAARRTAGRPRRSGLRGRAPVTRPEADEVVARQRARVVQRQVAHHRHAVVLDLAVAQRARPVRVVAHQRLQHEGPVRGDARRAVLGHMRQEQRRAAARRSAPAPGRRRPATPRWPGSAGPGPARPSRPGRPRPKRYSSSCACASVRSSALTSTLSSTRSTSKKKYRSTCTMSSVTGASPGLRHHAHRRHVAAAEHPHRRSAVGIASRHRAARALRRTGSAARRAGRSRTRCSGARESRSASPVYSSTTSRQGEPAVAQVAQHLPRRPVRARRAVAPASGAAATAAPGGNARHGAWRKLRQRSWVHPGCTVCRRPVSRNSATRCPRCR